MRHCGLLPAEQQSASFGVAVAASLAGTEDNSGGFMMADMAIGAVEEHKEEPSSFASSISAIVSSAAAVLASSFVTVAKPPSLVQVVTTLELRIMF